MANIDINAIQIKPHDPFSGYLPLTKESVERVEKMVQRDFVYGDEGNGGELKHFFEEIDQKNTNRDSILHKIMLIDYTYSTNLVKQKSKITVFDLADNIKRIENFDKKLENGDISAVSDILSKIKKVNLISFASKYCLNHNRLCYGKDAFSVYDSVVLKAIPHYVEPKNGDFKSFHSSVKSISDYESFYNLMSKILELYDAELSSSRFANQKRHVLDHFLWFPNKPSKEENAIKDLLKNCGIKGNISKPFKNQYITQFLITPKQKLDSEKYEKLKKIPSELEKKLKVEKVCLVEINTRSDFVGIEIHKEQKQEDADVFLPPHKSEPWSKA